MYFGQVGSLGKKKKKGLFAKLKKAVRAPIKIARKAGLPTGAPAKMLRRTVKKLKKPKALLQIPGKALRAPFAVKTPLSPPSLSPVTTPRAATLPAAVPMQPPAPFMPQVDSRWSYDVQGGAYKPTAPADFSVSPLPVAAPPLTQFAPQTQSYYPDDYAQAPAGGEYLTEAQEEYVDWLSAAHPDLYEAAMDQAEGGVSGIFGYGGLGQGFWSGLVQSVQSLAPEYLKYEQQKQELKARTAAAKADQPQPVTYVPAPSPLGAITPYLPLVGIGAGLFFMFMRSRGRRR
jgi:hypothetical protein